MGCNAIRTSHNPPAPELLESCDRMGFVVMDEAFDCWAKQKRPGDYHLLFPDWHEKDLRAQKSGVEQSPIALDKVIVYSAEKPTSLFLIIFLL